MSSHLTTEIANLANRMTTAGRKLEQVKSELAELTQSASSDEVSFRRLKRRSLDLSAEMETCEAGLRSLSYKLTA